MSENPDHDAREERRRRRRSVTPPPVVPRPDAIANRIENILARWSEASASLQEMNNGVLQRMADLCATSATNSRASDTPHTMKVGLMESVRDVRYRRNTKYFTTFLLTELTVRARA